MANSDYPGPVLLELLEPPLAGAVVSGEFALVRERLVLRLTRLEYRGRCVPVDAWAVVQQRHERRDRIQADDGLHFHPARVECACKHLCTWAGGVDSKLSVYGGWNPGFVLDVLRDMESARAERLAGLLEAGGRVSGELRRLRLMDARRRLTVAVRPCRQGSAGARRR